MKQWTQHDARADQLVEAGQFNEQHQSFRSQMTGLDRSQYPASCLTQGQVTTSAMHHTWVFSPWDTGVANAEGEQTVLRADSANTLPEQFRAVNYFNYGSGWRTVFEATLSPFKGGNLLVEWYGNSCTQTMFQWTKNAQYLASSSKYGTHNYHWVGVRILFNGVVVAERLGPAKGMDFFSIVGAQQMPSGPVVMTLQFKPPSAGPDDPYTDTGGDHLCQAHVFGNRVFAIGRFR